MLTKTEVVLRRGPASTEAHVEFDPDDAADGPFLTIERWRWQQMGEPNELVVRIEPGDRIDG